LEVARAAAREAGSFVRNAESRLQPHQVGEKGANDLVTWVDLESQRRIADRLHEAFPGDAIVGEETIGDRAASETGASEHQAGISPASSPEGGPGEGTRRGARLWYIDPLDGTTNFIHRFPIYAVSLALVEEGEVVLGVTYDPNRNEMFWAVKGEGAFLGDSPIRVSAVEDRSRTLIGTGFPFRARMYLDDYLKTFRYFFNNARGVRRAGSATLDLAYVAAGRMDAFWELTLSPWDMAAGVVLVEEAGGRVTDFFGGRSFLESGHIVASNGLFHDWMLRAIQEVFPPGREYKIPPSR